MFTGTARYELVTKLGEGGMGVVYEAYDRIRDMRIALKVLRSLRSDNILRFKREFRALSGLSHPNIIHLYELVQDGDHWFFTMELVNGQDCVAYARDGRSMAIPDSDEHALDGDSGDTMTADTRIGSNLLVESSVRVLALKTTCLPRPLPIRPELDRIVDMGRLRAVLTQLAGALHTLHAANLVHCDLKPSNVLVTQYGRVVLMDFGIVAELSQPWRGRHGVDYMGTPHFMAPEQAVNDPMSAAVDWYAFGVLMYVALTGLLPYRGPRAQVIQAKQHCDPLPPSMFTAGLPGDLESLCMALLSRDPAERPAGPEVLERLGVATRTARGPGMIAVVEQRNAQLEMPFVGRARELDNMGRHLAAVRAGATRCVLVQGPSGIGKSALLDRFEADLAALGPVRLLLLSGRCHERESLAYKAFDGVIDDLVRHLLNMPAAERQRLLPADAVCIARLFPALHQILESRDRIALASHPPARQRAKAVVALKALLAALARTRTIVMRTEDLQWADRDSLDLLMDIVQPPAPGGLLVLASLRSDAVDDAVAAAQDGHDSHLARVIGTLEQNIEVDSIRLDPLAIDEQRELLGKLTTSPEYRAIQNHLADSQWQKLGGHPMLLVELALFASQSPDAMVPPEMLQLDDFLWNRFARLPQGARALMECIALAGKPLPLFVLGRASALSATECERAANALCVAHLARVARTDPEPWLLPYHDQVREAISARLAGPRIVTWHRRIARALEVWENAPPATLADHWLAAGAPIKAAFYRFQAACRATEILAFEQAIELYRSVLDLLSATGPDRDHEIMRCRACIGLAQGGRVIERSDEAMALLDKAQAIASRYQLVAELATIHYLRGNLLFPRSDFAGCLEQHTIARDYARQAKAPELEARVLSGLGDAYYMRGRMASAYQHFERCIELCRKHGYSDIEAANLAMRGTTRYYRNELAAALQDGLNAMSTAVRFGDKRAEIMARSSTVAWILFEMGQFDQAWRELDISLAMCRELGMRRFEPNCYAFMSKIATHQGRRSEALALAETGVALCRELDIGFVGPMALAALALAAGDPQTRGRALDEGRDILRSGAISHNHLYFYRDATDVALADRDPDAMERHAQALEDYTRPEPLPWCAFFIARARALAEHLRGRGRPDRLQQLLARARDVGLHLAAQSLERALDT